MFVSACSLKKLLQRHVIGSLGTVVPALLPCGAGFCHAGDRRRSWISAFLNGFATRAVEVYILQACSCAGMLLRIYVCPNGDMLSRLLLLRFGATIMLGMCCGSTVAGFLVNLARSGASGGRCICWSWALPSLTRLLPSRLVCVSRASCSVLASF